MIRWAANYLASVPAVFIDGSTYIAIAVFAAALTMYSSDDAAKYVDPETLWKVKGGLGVVSAGLLALKMFRSTAYAEHQEDKRRSGDTAHIVKP